MTQDDAQQLAERVRNACLEVAMRSLDEAAMAGLCGEGQREAAVDAIRSLDLEALLAPPT